MKIPTPRSLLRRLALAGTALGAAWSVQAATVEFNFDTDPSGILTIVGNRQAEVWRDTGGNPGGYLAITDAGGSQDAGILFDDFDQGLVVSAFSFEADFRVGNGTTERPADGFSISFARENDPLIASMEAGQLNYGDFGVPATGGAPEFGSTTGLAVSFDTWAGNALPDGPDIEGIIVRVDNVTIIREGLPTRHGACDDTTSLQTGPRVANSAGEFDGDPSVLCWQRFTAALSEEGKLTVTWKGRRILDERQISYAPSRGRLIFAGRTGGANENHHVDNVRITTVGADKVIIGQVAGNPIGFAISTIDSGQGVADPNTVQLVFNGNPVTPTSVNKAADGTTSITYENVAAPLAIGSTNVVVLTIRDTRGQAVTATREFVVAPYVTLPPSYAVDGVNTGAPGFNITVHQTATRGQENTVARAEQQLQGLRGANVADISQGGFAGNVFTEPTVVNYSQPQADGVTPEQNGFFQANLNDPALDFPDRVIPGIPSATEFNPDSSYYTDNIAAKITTYLHFAQAGAYRLYFNSDDGFRTTAAPDVDEVLSSLLVSQADIGRGAVDSIAWVYVPTPGYYAFRSVWFEGGGGASFEWSADRVAPNPARRLLINDPDAASLKAYRSRTGTTTAAVTFLHPFRDSGNPYVDSAPLVFNIRDGSTPVDAGSIQVLLNGAPLTVTPTKSGNVTTINYTGPGGVLPAGTHTVELRFTAGAQNYAASNTFTIRSVPSVPPSLALAPGSVNTSNVGFLIKTVQQDSGESMGNDTYRGLVHFAGFIGFPNTADLSSFTGPNNSFVQTGVINFTSTGGTGYWNAGNGYPDEGVPGIPGSAAADGGTDNYVQEILTVLDLQPGLYSMNVNSDDGFITTIGNPAEAFTLPLVVGEFSGGRGQGGGFADGTTFYFRVTQAGLYPFRTLWYEGGGGSGIEWSRMLVDPVTGGFTGKVLINDVGVAGTINAYQYPVTSAGSPYVKSFLPPRSGRASGVAPSRSGPDAAIRAVLADGAGNVNPANVTLTVDGNPVTATVNKAGTETTVTYAPAGGWAPGSTHTAALTFGDRTVSWSFIISSTLPATPTFFIEAEDFDNGGSGQAAASVMPYIGGAYAGLGATFNTDYNRGNEPSSPIYRMGEDPQVPMDRTGDRDRGVSELAVNYKIGWIGGGQWYNYTRNFPAGSYNVYAGLSHGDGDTSATRIGGNLATVSGGTPTVVGAFFGNATGGWGNNALVPLRDTAATNDLVAVNLGGQQTVRFNTLNGDFDFLLFVPAGVSRPQITSITQSGGNVTIVWEGGGTLETADEVTGPWTNTGLSSPVTAPIQGLSRFGRIRQ